MKVSQEMFHRWKHDPVTEVFFEYMRMIRAEINEAMISELVIRSKDCQLQQWELLGKKTFVEDILEIKFDLLEGVELCEK